MPPAGLWAGQARAKTGRGCEEGLLAVRLAPGRLHGTILVMGDSDVEQHGEQLLAGLDSSQRDALRMLFREFRTRNTFAIRRGATRKANKEKCRRFLGDYKALSGEKERDALAVTAMLDALQPADNPGCQITMSAFVEGLGQVVSRGAQPDAEMGAASVQDRLSGWIEGCARPILEEQIPPKYWQAMLRVKQALSASTDGQLVALLRRNSSAVKKLFDSEAMGVGGIGRLGRGKALTVQQMHQIFLRCSVQGPWLSMHGTDLIISLVKAWSSADSSKTASHAPDDSLVEEDNAITKQEFTRCLMMAAHVVQRSHTVACSMPRQLYMLHTLVCPACVRDRRSYVSHHCALDVLWRSGARQGRWWCGR